LNEHTTRVSDDGTLILTFPNVKAGFEQWFLLSSDRHWDSPDSDRAMQKRHLEQAVERNAMVFDFGDLIDGMGGRNDRRMTKSGIRAEFNVDGYFTELINQAVDWFKPYAKQFKLIATGNHESAVLKHNEVDLTRQIVRLLNAEANANIVPGKYAGWIRLQFQRSNNASAGRHLIRYTHGSGGSSPVTRGVIQTNRRAVWLPDADTIISGHVHQNWLVTIPRERITERGRVYFDEQNHLQLPSYKRASLHEGFAAERGFAPTPIGAWWLRFWFENEQMKHEFTRAQ